MINHRKNYEGGPRNNANPSVISSSFGIPKNGLHIYEGCQKSSWTLMIKASSVPEFDNHYYVSLK